MDTGQTMPYHHSVPNPRSAGVLTWFDPVAEPRTRYIGEMKTSSLPAVSVEPALRADVEAVLEEGESMDEFIEDAVAERVLRRKAAQAAFIARASTSLEESKRTGVVFPLDEVERELRREMDDAHRRLAAQRELRR